MREEAFKRIGHLYPKVKITDEMIAERPDLKAYAGEELTVIAWLWARTVKSPNPAFSHVDVPLVSSFVLSSKKGKEHFVKPEIENDVYRFKVKSGKPSKEAEAGTSAGKRKGFVCLISGTPVDYKYIRDEGTQGRMGQKLMAVVVKGKAGRVYLSPTNEIANIAAQAQPTWKPETPLHGKSRVNVSNYGLDVYGDLFTPRQLVALTTFSDLVQEARNKVIEVAKAAGMANDDLGIDAGGTGATAYGDALAVYLSLALGKASDYNSSICSWISGGQTMRNTFGMQAIPMVWDYAEANIVGNTTGGFLSGIDQVYRVINKFTSGFEGKIFQQDAATQNISVDKVISTDPPYYDNIGYADLSDFFYVWMRRSLKEIYPELFSTMAVPKAEELVATPYRHGSKEKAETFFLDGMTQAIHNMAAQSHPAFPVSIYYAFKQSETKEASTSSAGWETFLEAVLSAGFSIDGTWPMRTERSSRMVASGTNALASSIVLVCKKREIEAYSISRREFQRELRDRMPDALEAMIGGETGTTPIAPVDLAQAAIGPGIAIYSKYQAVLNQDGSKMSVHDALILINRAITDHLNPDSGNSDADTLFCDDWFSQYGWSPGQFGEADTLARAKGTSVEGVRDAGVIEASGGNVQLLKWSEYPQDWNPRTDARTPIWEACHHMIRALNNAGEGGAGALLAGMPELGEPIRQLAYHLYTICERKKWSDDALAYNELIGSWHAIVRVANEVGFAGTQSELGLDF